MSSWIALDPIRMGIAASMAIVGFVVSLWKHATHRTFIFDLGVNDQAIWKLSDGVEPVVSALGWNVFADHLSLVLVPLSWLYLLSPSVAWLFGIQALSAAAAFLLVRPWLDTLAVPRRWAVVLEGAFAASPLLWNAVFFDFHPSTLAVPFLVLGLHAAHRDAIGALTLASAGLVFLRDDLGVTVAILAAVGWSTSVSPHRRARLALGLAGLGMVVFGSAVASHFGVDRHWATRYGYLGTSPSDALMHPLDSVPAALGHLWSSDAASAVLAWALASGLLALFAPRRFAVVLFLAAPILLADDPFLTQPTFHYGAPLLPFLVWAAVDGIPVVRRLIPRPDRALQTAVAMVLALSFVLFGPPRNERFDAPPFDPSDAAAAFATIPGDASVVASNNLGAHLAQRETLVEFPWISTTRRCDDGVVLSHLGTFDVDAPIDVIILHTEDAEFYAELLDQIADSACGERLGDPEAFGEVLVWRAQRTSSAG